MQLTGFCLLSRYLLFVVQGPSQEATKKLGEFVLGAVREFKALDTSALQKYVA